VLPDRVNNRNVVSVSIDNGACLVDADSGSPRRDCDGCSLGEEHRSRHHGHATDPRAAGVIQPFRAMSFTSCR
jgi:hypothetical protein